MKKILFIITTSLVFLFSINFINVKAASNPKEKPFSAKLELPYNQEKGVKSYFNLHVKPKQKQTVYINLTNQESNTITVKISPTNALNSPTGGIIYTPKKKDDYSTLIDKDYYMDKNIIVPKEVTLAAFEQKKIPIKINVPNMDAGKLLGGILFELKQTELKEIENKKKEISFSGKVSIAQAIAIQLNLPKEAKNAPLKISDIKSANLANGMNVIFTLENSSADIQKRLNLDYSIKKDGETIFNGNISDFNVSPKSVVKMQIPWKGSKVAQGIYDLNINTPTGQNIYSDKFKVSNASVLNYSKQSGEKIVIPVLNIPIYIYIIAVVFILITIYLAFIFGKRKANVKGDKKVA
ncbi:hypothetical protein B4102_2133 [Heyndrickxia sporothermodurans]|uniref:Uncharacterized protein n=1 Tax=Heyndrickxia sporothermodurans TaxID=46224 RepID=A0A150LGN3_9BACI|nr:DUF916 domain-containing protein [Heyndrickxia sporothermodurans]KYD11405.1 hypothetical protein B4102_2133 [Heyndrickxia sporothermodurans]